MNPTMNLAMNALDWTVLGIIALSCAIGGFRGAVREIVGLGGWLGAIVIAWLVSPVFAPLLIDLIANESLRWLAAYILIFIAVRICAWGLGTLAKEIIQAAHLGGLDRFAGALFGILRGAFFVLMLAMGAMMTRMPSTTLWQQASSKQLLEKSVTTAAVFLPKDAQKWIYHEKN